LEQLAAPIPRIRFAGNLSQSELAEAFSVARLFVLPSITLERTAEGVSTAVMQAMAAGLPVVSTNTGSMADIVTAKSGLLVPERDPEAIARAALSILVNTQRWQAMRAHNQRWAKQKDWSVIAKQVDEVYRLTLGERWR
jgi:glycosyltransferase involved in cell wall biosynthesis